MLSLATEEVRRDPYPLYARMRGAEPVFHDPASGLWMLFDYAGVKRALDDHEAFSSAVSPPESKPGRWFIFSDPPRHTRLRALVTRAFTSRSVAGLEPRVRELARRLLDRRMERGEMELVGDFSAPLPLMVIAEMLGVAADDWPRFRRWSDGIVNLAGTLQGGAEAERAVAGFIAVHAEMEVYLAELIEE